MISVKKDTADESEKDTTFETAEQRLAKKNIFALPETIDQTAYIETAAFLAERPKKAVTIYVSGNGGNSDSMYAIVNLIRNHGKVTGILLGDSYSAHSVIFCACETRLTAPFAALGIHESTSYNWSRIVNREAAMLKEGLEYHRQSMATIYAQASNKPKAYWLKVLDSIGGGSCKMYKAADLFDLEMAKLWR